MGNKQCCQVDNRDYQQTFPDKEQESNIKAVKLQTKEEHKQPEIQTVSPTAPHPHHQQEAKPEPELDIEVVEEKQPIQLPPLNPQVQAKLQDYNDLDTEIETNRQIKEFGKQIYVGQLDQVKGIPQGLGKIYKTDGSIYLGSWNQGKAEGKGVYIKNDGSFYEGEFHHNNAEGRGKFVCNSLIYEGGFRANKFQGDGVQKGKDYSFEGEYQSGCKVKGLLIWKSDQEQYEYKGQFNSKNQFHGKGSLKEPEGVYEGQFEDGQKHGKGEYRFENGLKYIGEYRKGKKWGNGILYNCNNTIAYEGEFEDDLPHGEGAIYDEKGVKNRRRWVKGIDTEGL